MEGQKTGLKMIRMSEVESQEVKWLWYPFIPYGKLTIIQEDPGDGKTTLVLNIAAKLSKGECFDSDMDVQEPVNVIYQTAEDGLADTVKPRLELAGADCEKILVIDERDKSLSIKCEEVEAALRTTEQSLAKLHRLLDNKPIEYVAMALSGEMQAYCDIEDDMVKGMFGTIVQGYLKNGYNRVTAEMMAREFFRYES